MWRGWAKEKEVKERGGESMVTKKGRKEVERGGRKEVEGEGERR